MCTDITNETQPNIFLATLRFRWKCYTQFNEIKYIWEPSLSFKLIYNSSAWEYLWNIKKQKQNKSLRKPLKVSTPRAAKYNMFVDIFLPKNLLISS